MSLNIKCLLYLRLETRKRRDLKYGTSPPNTRSATMFRILKVLENVRGLITHLVLTHPCGKMPGCFADIGRYNYNLAKYLCNLLSPHIPTEHCAIYTFIFVQGIQSLSKFGKFIVSFDVESLFTHIALEECIDLAVNCISEGNPDLKLTKSELRSLFTVATAQNFLFNGSFYDQIDGTDHI